MIILAIFFTCMHIWLYWK